VGTRITTSAVTFLGVPPRPDRRRSRGRAALRIAVLVVLLAAVFVILRTLNQPGLAVALYALVPILLAVYWFGLPGGLLTAAAALGVYLFDELVWPSPGFPHRLLWLATLNRALVFFGVAVLVTVLLRRERRMAQQLEEQRTQLTELEALRSALTPAVVPPTPGLDVATAFVPAEGMVAGDFFLVVEGPNDCTTVVVGDVVGHGLVAARSAAFLRATMATFAHFTADPAELLRLADTALRESDGAAESFVTAVCLTIAGNPERELRWATAGHPAPWALDTGTSLATGSATAPLGVQVDGLRPQVSRAPLGSGVLVFTDGLTEGRSVSRPPRAPVQLFGEDRARQVVRDCAGAPAKDVVAALQAAVTTFAGGRLADDLCLVAVRPI
jgi:serine phosphatase RsbU (regulator of sigma subunit)